MSDPHGYLCPLLHGHLPYVRHPEYPDFLEEDWFFEALTETYLPLINVIGGWYQDGVPFQFTISLSPPLMSMMADPLLQERYRRYLDRRVELACREVERTRDQPQFNHLAWMYRRRFESARYVYGERYHQDLLSAFRQFQDRGNVEVITTTATHGFLPLMEVTPASRRAQIHVGVQCYERFFGQRPKGMWLAECGYLPGDEAFLHEMGVRYFVVEAHGLLHGSPRPRYGMYAPAWCRNGVACFSRDLETAHQVWSAEQGYPGDPWYREFYRDIGFDLDYEYLRPFLHGDGIRTNTGIKYYRITGRGNHKEPYAPERAGEQVEGHAGNFMFNREQQIRSLHDWLQRPPIVVAPYDAELFGHWWFEGPQWLDRFVRKSASEQRVFDLITPSGYLERFPKNQVLEPSLSSWGYKGYNEVWLNGTNDWIYRHLHRASDRMTELARRFPQADGTARRALNQALRELLLAQSSDWAFILNAGTAVEYARKRFVDHIGRFTKLYQDLLGHGVDEGWLTDVEARDNLFPELDYRVHQ